MGQKTATDRLPEKLRSKVFSLLDDPALTQMEIVERINSEAGEKLLSRSSINRLANKRRKQKEKELANATSADKSLFRIADALERIARRLEES
jgi:predicted transcriptional regulator YheO